ncbi:MAG: ATP-binding protein [Bacteroidota bacterium]
MRHLYSEISSFLPTDKAILVQGSRQVGKTTLIERLTVRYNNVLWINGDDILDREDWGDINRETVLRQVAPYDCVVIDEAQRIRNVGLAIKIIIDAKLGKAVFISGSSSLNLNSTITEPLTGRKWTFELFPFTYGEIEAELGARAARRRLDNTLIHGTYPEVFTAETWGERRLREIASSYLYKDVLEYGNIKKPDVLVKLLRALSYQVGNTVSIHELSQLVRVDAKTVDRYIGLLEDSYVLFRLSPLSTNPRKELSTSRKIFFYDNGIRNVLINDLRDYTERNDRGSLWENYVIAEFHKAVAYAGKRGSLFFWRSRGGAEVDLILQYNGQYFAYEIKANPKKRVRFPKSFLEAYTVASTITVHPDNFSEQLAVLRNRLAL